MLAVKVPLVLFDVPFTNPGQSIQSKKSPIWLASPKLGIPDTWNPYHVVAPVAIIYAKMSVFGSPDGFSASSDDSIKINAGGPAGLGLGVGVGVVVNVGVGVCVIPVVGVTVGVGVGLSLIVGVTVGVCVNVGVGVGVSDDVGVGVGAPVDGVGVTVIVTLGVGVGVISQPTGQFSILTVTKALPKAV